jgi:hypothetical protein
VPSTSSRVAAEGMQRKAQALGPDREVDEIWKGEELSRMHTLPPIREKLCSYAPHCPKTGHRFQAIMPTTTNNALAGIGFPPTKNRCAITAPIIVHTSNAAP